MLDDESLIKLPVRPSMDALGILTKKITLNGVKLEIIGKKGPLDNRSLEMLC